MQRLTGRRLPLLLIAGACLLFSQQQRLMVVPPDNVENWFQFLAGRGLTNWSAGKSDTQAALLIGLTQQEYAKFKSVLASAEPQFVQLEADRAKLTSNKTAQAQHDMRRLRLTLSHMNKVADALTPTSWIQVKNFVVQLTPNARSPYRGVP